ncbi:MAG: S-layer family protein, partial [bacterium]|nr:S-layer family protein [bacterium]
MGANGILLATGAPIATVTVTADDDINIAGAATATGTSDAAISLGTALDAWGNDVIITGDVTATGGSAAADTGQVNIFTNRNVDINGGSVVATIGAGSGLAQVNIGTIADPIAGWINVHNAGKVTATGGNTANADINFFAAGNVTVDSGTVSATVGAQGAGTAAATVDFGATGANKIGGDVTVSNGGKVQATGGTGAVDHVNIYADGGIVVGSGAGTSLVSAASKTGSVNLSGAKIVVGSGTKVGSVTATGSQNAIINLTSTGSQGIAVGVNGTVLAKGGSVLNDVNLLAGTNAAADVTIYGNVQSGTGNSISKVDIDAKDMVIVGSNGTVLGSGITLGSVNINATGDVKIGVTGAGTVTATGTAATGNGMVVISGQDVTVGGAATNGAVLANGGSTANITVLSLGGGTGLTLGAAGSIKANVAGGTGVSSTVDLTAFTGGVFINGDVKAIAATGSAVANIDAMNGAGVVTIANGANVQATGTTVATVQINAAGALNSTGAVSIDGNVQAVGGTATVDVNSFNGGTSALLIDTNGTVLAKGATTSTANLDSNGAGGDVMIKGDVQAGTGVGAAIVNIDSMDQVIVRSGGSAKGSGATLGSVDIDATGNVLIGATGVASVKGIATAAGNANVNIDGANVTIGGTGANSGKVQATGITAANVKIDSTAGTSGIKVDVNGLVEASVGASGVLASVEMDADNNIALSGSVKATATAGNATILADTTAAGGVTVTNGANVLATAAGTSTVMVNNTGNGTGAILVDGNVKAVGSIGVVAIQSNNAGTSALVVGSNGSILANGTTFVSQVSLTGAAAGGDITIKGDVTAGTGAGVLSLINVTANDGSISTTNASTITTNTQNGGTSMVLISTGGGANAGNVDIQGPINVRGGSAITGSVTVTAAENVTMGVSGDITVNNGSGKGAVNVNITADNKAGSNLGAITMADGALIDAGSGIITMQADGDILLGGLVTTGTGGVVVDVQSFSKGILDNGDTHTDITAVGAGAWVSLQAEDLIGRVKNDDVMEDPGSALVGLRPDTDGTGNAIDTQMHSLIVVTDGNDGVTGDEISIDNTGNFALTLGKLGSANLVMPSQNQTASMYIRNDADITVSAWTLDQNDNVGLIATTGNVTIPDSGSLGTVFDGGTGAAFNFKAGQLPDISVGTGTVRLEASTKAGTGIVRDSGSNALTIQAEDLLLKSTYLNSENITNTDRFDSNGKYAYRANAEPDYVPLPDTTAFHVVAEVTNLDVEIAKAGADFHFAQANDAGGSANDLTVQDLDADGNSMVINGNAANPDADILLYGANGTGAGASDGLTLTIDDAVSALDGNIALWVDSAVGQTDGGVVIGSAARVTTDAGGDQLGALYIEGDTNIQAGAVVNANSGEVLVIHASANHIIIQGHQVGAGTVSLDPGGNNEWDIRFMPGSSLTVNAGDLNIKNAATFEMRSAGGSVSYADVNNGGDPLLGNVNIDDVYNVVMAAGTRMEAEGNINVGQDTAGNPAPDNDANPVYYFEMDSSATLNAFGDITIEVEGPTKLGALNSDLDGVGGGNITVTAKNTPSVDPVGDPAFGKAGSASPGAVPDNTALGAQGDIALQGVLNPNGNNVTLTSSSGSVGDSGGEVVDTNIFTVSAKLAIGTASDAIDIDALVVDSTATGTGAATYINNTPSGNVRADFNSNGGPIVYSQQGQDLLLVDDLAWGGLDVDGSSVLSNNGDVTMDPPVNVIIASDVNVGTGTYILSANGNITQGPGSGKLGGDILAKNVYLVADLDKNGVGSFIQDASSTAVSIVATGGNVDIEAAAFRLDDVQAATGRIDLIATTGNVVEFAHDAGADLVAQTINIVADAGTIGAAAAPGALEFDATTRLDADTSQGNTDMYLAYAGAGGSANIGLLNAGGGIITLDASGTGAAAAVVDANLEANNITASQLNISNATTIDLDTTVGVLNLSSTGNVTIDEANGLDNVMITSASGGIDVEANGSVDLLATGVLSAGSDKSIAVTTSSGSITIDAAATVTSPGSGGITLEAAGNVDVELPILNAVSGDVVLTSFGGNVDVVGITANDATLTAQGNVTSTGVVTAAGDVVYDAQGTAKNTGAIGAAGSVTITSNAAGAAAVDVDAAITAGSGDVTLTANLGNVDADAKVTSTSADVIITGQQVDVTAVSAASGDIRMTATDTSVTATGLVAAGSNVLIGADTSVTVGQVTAGNDFRVDAGTTFQNNGTVVATGDAVVVAQDQLKVGAALSGATVSLESTAADLDLNATVTATGGDMSLKAATNIVGTALISTKTGDIVMNAGSAVTVGAVTAGTAGSGDIVAVAGTTFANSGAVTARGDITVDADTSIITNGGVTATGGDVDFVSEGLIQINSALSGGTVDLNSTANAVDLQNTVSSTGGAVIITAATTIDSKAATGTITAATLAQLTAGGAITLLDGVGANSIQILSQTGGVSVEALTAATGDLTVNAGAGAFVTNTALVQATAGDVIITADGGITTGAGVTATAGDLTLTSAAAIDTAGNALTAGSDINVNGGTTVDLDAVTAGAAVSVTGVGAVDLDGAVSGATVNIESTGSNLDIGATVDSTGGALTLIAATDIATTGAGAPVLTATGGDATLTAGGSITLIDQIQSTGAAVILTAGSNVAVEQVDAGTDVLVNAGGTFGNSGVVTGADDVNISADGGITAGADIAATSGDLSLTSAGSIDTAGNALSAGSDIN